MRTNYDTQVDTCFYQTLPFKLTRVSYLTVFPISHGVEGYYNKVSESYRNPHFLGLKKVLNEFMDRYMEHERPSSLDIVDLAAGSGEATEALLAWRSFRWPTSSTSATESSTTSSTPTPTTSIPASIVTRPPFIPPTRRPIIARPTKPSPISSLPMPTLNIIASDPFTAPGYRIRTGLPCLELSFADVAEGKLPSTLTLTPAGNLPLDDRTSRTDMSLLEEGGEEEGRYEEEEGRYDLVIISFALHLVESTSELWALLTELSKRCKWLVVMAPHKKPEIKASWGWTRWDPRTWREAEGKPNAAGTDEGDGWEIVLDRTRLRVWKSDYQVE
ncbi:BZ3500_MvSof-1268-A1-R1_Chr3-1g06068 [Microbotryum saponariae]|uniref:BZ3500_MvSof-1268-A1-R1_Chr3-1g06068 protein n=1 Tax=Microbotryum saponariae TaxID=289078 RepID=A0A2X0LAH4_9BASI|nr:BZ3500_MvSof-1268-A1-R1_Chr3-1g06068 [Microbotryum saponariae]SDA03901.1 BZ3501_MvSof-1269-A2-R1_Chr3-2g05753 [Microbotryum saponariae]